MTTLQHQKIDQTELLKADCIDIAKQSWLINQHPPFVVGFKGEHQFPMMLPGFSTTQAIQDRFLEIVTESEDWDGIAIFTVSDKRGYQIKLIVPDKIVTATADIIDDYGGVSLTDFGCWQRVDETGISLTDCINRDVDNACKRRLKYG